MTTDTRYIAENIIEQLGRNRFAAMTGARDFMSLEAAPRSGIRGGVQFAIGQNVKGVRKVRVELTTDDDYTVSTWGCKGRLDWFEINRVAGVYADTLREVFTAETGLDTSL